MYLKSLEVSGFKSFAKKATLHFTSPITGIVGPNGSGKSNVAEAFSFVLGEQSIRSLRGKRGEDLIWNGGVKHATEGRANRASAKLVFDNSRRIFSHIDFDEVSLERVVHRDNSNEYLLNGSQVRLKDIVEILAGAHIGATGHHIISQGAADRILSASIRERREMIEDALGLKVYQWKKLESIRKLERTEDNMKQVESLRREIAPHLKFLKKQVEKMEKAELMRQELVALYQQYFATEDAHIRHEKVRIATELRGPLSESETLERELATAKQILTSSSHADHASAEIVTLENKLSQIRRTKDDLVRELGRLEGEVASSRRVIEKEKEKQKRDEFKTVYLKDVEEVIMSIERLQSLEDVRTLFNEVITALRGFVARHRGSTDSSLIGEVEADIATLLKTKEEVDVRVAELIQKEHVCIQEYTLLKNSIEREKDTNREAEKSVFRIIARQNEVRTTIAALRAHEQRVLHEEDVFKKDLGEAGMIAGRDAVNYGELARSDLASSPHLQEDRRRQIEKIKIRLEDAGGVGGSDVVKEYRETEERDVFLGRELGDLDSARTELISLITELDQRLDIEFKSGILKINTEFNTFFSLMFGGGKAELAVVSEPRRRKKSDTEDLGDMLRGDMNDSASTENEEQGPEGLEVSVSLPKKKVKSLMMLSGGERALTSIALLFAISQVNPPPFIILDETDAALDEANSKKYGDMIENLSKHSQLILITHNRETMSRAGVLYGVTVGAEGASRLLSIAFEEAVQVAK
jgi:chromosome segregation ATPase